MSAAKSIERTKAQSAVPLGSDAQTKQGTAHTVPFCRLLRGACAQLINVFALVVVTTGQLSAQTPKAEAPSGPTAQIKRLQPGDGPQATATTKSNSRAATTSGNKRMDTAIERAPIGFDQLPGWADDDHAAAFAAFQKSCQRLLQKSQKRTAQGERANDLVALCLAQEQALKGKVPTRAVARQFFEAHFTAVSLTHKGPEGFVTGYYEPLIKGSKTQTGAYQTPVYRRPSDLINVVEETQRASKQQGFTHLRRLADGTTKPYFTRQEIDEGALKGKNLELVWLADPVEAFFMHVQGSARIAFPDGKFMRITYDGKNGHPYTSVGRQLIERNVMGADRMTLGNLGQWLRADAKRGREAMWLNRSFVFFRELTGPDVDGPLGSLEIPLSPGRSLAVDTAFHELGLPIYISVPSLKHWAPGGKGEKGFHRLMIAQDVGSAIKGPERGDVFFGAGDDAGKIAGQTKNAARFYVLVPKPQASSAVHTSTVSTGAAKKQSRP